MFDPLPTASPSAIQALIPPTKRGSTVYPINSHNIKIACSNCNLRELCLPLGLNCEEIAKIDTLVNMRRKIKKGEILFHTGERFSSLFAIRTGFFKSSVGSAEGHEQVTGFQMAGEVLGLDGISNEHHNCDAMALEDSEVCGLPFERIEELSREIVSMQRHMNKILSREIVRENGVMMLLGSMRAEERMAAFLLNLVDRLHARGFSHTELVLRMSRAEIGSYLGLKLETVSRAFSKFAEDGLIAVEKRNIRILRSDLLHEIVGRADARPSHH